MDYPSQARVIVERAYGNVKGPSQLPNWEDLRLEEFLVSPSSIREFWALIVEELHRHFLRPRDLRELHSLSPDSLRTRRGRDLINLIERYLNSENDASKERERIEGEERARAEESKIKVSGEREIASGKREIARVEQERIDRAKPKRIDAAKADAASDRVAEQGQRQQSQTGEVLRALQPPPDNASLVRVLYATDRFQIDRTRVGPQYNFKRSKWGKIQYGECTISVPEDSSNRKARIAFHPKARIPTQPEETHHPSPHTKHGRKSVLRAGERICCQIGQEGSIYLCPRI